MSNIALIGYSGNMNTATVVSNVQAALRERGISDTVVVVTFDKVLVIGTQEGIDAAKLSMAEFEHSKWSVARTNVIQTFLGVLPETVRLAIAAN